MIKHLTGFLESISSSLRQKLLFALYRLELVLPIILLVHVGSRRQIVTDVAFESLNYDFMFVSGNVKEGNVEGNRNKSSIVRFTILVDQFRMLSLVGVLLYILFPIRFVWSRKEFNFDPIGFIIKILNVSWEYCKKLGERKVKEFGPLLVHHRSSISRGTIFCVWHLFNDAYALFFHRNKPSRARSLASNLFEWPTLLWQRRSTFSPRMNGANHVSRSFPPSNVQNSVPSVSPNYFMNISNSIDLESILSSWKISPFSYCSTFYEFDQLANNVFFNNVSIL